MHISVFVSSATSLSFATFFVSLRWYGAWCSSFLSFFSCSFLSFIHRHHSSVAIRDHIFVLLSFFVLVWWCFRIVFQQRIRIYIKYSAVFPIPPFISGKTLALIFKEKPSFFFGIAICISPHHLFVYHIILDKMKILQRNGKIIMTCAEFSSSNQLCIAYTLHKLSANTFSSMENAAQIEQKRLTANWWLWWWWRWLLVVYIFFNLFQRRPRSLFQAKSMLFHQTFTLTYVVCVEYDAYYLLDTEMQKKKKKHKFINMNEHSNSLAFQFTHIQMSLIIVVECNVCSIHSF